MTWGRQSTTPVGPHLLALCGGVEGEVGRYAHCGVPKDHLETSRKELMKGTHCIPRIPDDSAYQRPVRDYTALALMYKPLLLPMLAQVKAGYMPCIRVE